jgi:hypothetical protein
VLASTLAAECAALAVTAAVVAMLGVMPGGVLCVAGALALAAWPDAVLSPAWLPVCGALAAGGALLARAAIRGRWR